MERRRFIQQAAVAGIGLSAVPLSAIASLRPALNTTYALNEARAQVRHGLFNPSIKGNLGQPLIGEWIYAYDRFVMLDNGYEIQHGKDKLFHSLILGENQDLVQFTLEGEKVHFWKNERPVNSDVAQNPIIHESEDFCAQLLTFEKGMYKYLSESKEYFIHPLGGQLMVDELVVTSTSPLICTRSKAVIQSLEASVVLLISTHSA